MNEKLETAMIKGLILTTNELLNSDAKANEPKKLVDFTKNKETNVIIGITGELEGTLILQSEKSFAVFSAKQMLEIDVDDESEDAKGAIEEFFNIAVGKTKQIFSPSLDTFKVSVPTTIFGSDYNVHVNSDHIKNVTTIDFTIDNTYNVTVNMFIKNLNN